MQPADFYTGAVAELYEPLKSEREGPERYARFIREYGEPALELGCGDGDPLLDLRRRGLDVDGVDSSADMLDRLHGKAADAGMNVTVRHQRMEELDLPRRYRIGRIHLPSAAPAGLNPLGHCCRHRRRLRPMTARQ